MLLHGRNSSKPHREWETLIARNGESLNDRAHELRHDHPEMTKMEAKVKTLAEQGFDPMDTAIALGISEGTVNNHRWHIRKKAGESRKVHFKDIYMSPPPVEK